MNTYLRRVDLLCKLLAPLFVSLLTSTISYPVSVMIFLGIAIVTLVFELVWINVVWRRFHILSVEESRRPDVVQSSRDNGELRSPIRKFQRVIQQQVENFKELAGLPVFLSTLLS